MAPRTPPLFEADCLPKFRLFSSAMPTWGWVFRCAKKHRLRITAAVWSSSRWDGGSVVAFDEQGEVAGLPLVEAGADDAVGAVLGAVEVDPRVQGHFAGGVVV